MKSLRRLMRLFRRRQSERELDAELRIHVERRADELRRAGLGDAEARRRALVELGGTQQIKEEVRALRTGVWLETLWQNLCFATRQLRKNPGFAAVAILTLALGIGASTAIFSVLNAVLLRPLPFPEADRLVRIYSLTLDISKPSEWNQRSTVYEEFATVSLTGGVTWIGPEGEERPDALWVAPEFFSLLALRPQLGRPFLAEDALGGGQPVAIVTHRFWLEKLGGQAEAIGQTLALNQKLYTIVGVLPEDLGILHMAAFEILLPASKSGPGYIAYARLRPGVTLESAQAEARAIAARFPAGPRSSPDGHLVFIEPYLDTLVRHNQRTALLVLAGAVGFALLIACVNVANLLLARATGRDREIAIRSAMGAGRRRLVKQLLTESLLLSVVSTAAALLIARWCISFFLYLLPYRLPRIQQAVTLDSTLFAFAALLAVMTSVLCGLVPALEATRVDLSLAFRAGARGAGGTSAHRRIRSALVVTEVALATVLLLGAGLLVKTFLILRPANAGFDASNKLILRMSLREKFFSQPAQQAAFLRDASERIGSLPGVRAVAATTALPFVDTGGYFSTVMVDGKLVSPTHAGNNFTPNLYYKAISPNYFRVMGMPVVAGRDFATTDAEGGPYVTIVNQTMARKYWRNESPLGRRLIIGSEEKRNEYSIVGIVRDARIFASSSTPRPEFYIPYDQAPWRYLALVVHRELDASPLVPAVRAAVRSVNPDALVLNIQMYDKFLDDAVAAPRFHATLMGLLAGLAVLLAVVGIYGVIAYSLIQRTQEIGVRIALGARPTVVLRMFLRRVLLLVAVGLVIGLGGAWGLTRYMRSLLYEVPPTDVATFAVVTLLWLAVAALACYVPGRRVLRVDPAVTLRYE